MAGADLAHLGQVAVLGEHDPEVHHRRLHDHAGGLAALGVEALDAALHRAGVVERHRDRHVDGGLRDARAVGQRGEVLAVADLVVLDPDRDHHRVVVAVVGAEDLHDGVAARVGARDPDRVHRRLGAGVRVAPARQAPAALQVLGDDDRVLGRGGEVRAARVALLHRAPDRRVRVALDHRAEAVVEVEVLVAVDVPDARAVAAARGRSATGRAAGRTTRRRRRARRGRACRSRRTSASRSLSRFSSRSMSSRIRWRSIWTGALTDISLLGGPSAGYLRARRRSGARDPADCAARARAPPIALLPCNFGRARERLPRRPRRTA